MFYFDNLYWSSMQNFITGIIISLLWNSNFEDLPNSICFSPFFCLTKFPLNLYAFRESIHGWFWKPFSSGVPVYEGNSVVLGCHMQNVETGKWGETPLYEGWIHWGLWCTSTLSRDWFCWLLQQSSKAAKVWYPWSHVCSTMPEEQSEACKFILLLLLPFCLRVLVLYFNSSNGDVSQVDSGFVIPFLEEVVITVRSPLNAEQKMSTLESLLKYGKSLRSMVIKILEMKSCHSSADDFFDEICRFRYMNHNIVRIE